MRSISACSSGTGAQQLATYIGWLLHKVKGGLVAGMLFILPGLLAIMALSWIYVLYGGAAPVEGSVLRPQGGVLAIVFQAVIRIGSRALGNPTRSWPRAAFRGDLPVRALPLIVSARR
jgi:chromate transporter